MTARDQRPANRGLTDSQKRHRKEEAIQREERLLVLEQARKEQVTANHVAEWLQDPSALKRAVVMQEVLGPPVSLR